VVTVYSDRVPGFTCEQCIWVHHAKHCTTQAPHTPVRYTVVLVRYIAGPLSIVLAAKKEVCLHVH
jgi:hypothetical protein